MANRKLPAPTPWWVPILLSFLGLTAAFLTVAYFAWIRVDGRLSWFGLFMVGVNLAVTVAAIVATGMDVRTGRVSWRWWTVLGTLVVASILLFPFMGGLA